MSTSLLYHGWGLHGYLHESSRYEGGAVIFRISKHDDDLRCPGCDRSEVQRQGAVVRTFKALPIGSKPVVLELPVPRVWCPSCGVTRQVRVGFADEHRRYTRAFERYALELSKMGTILSVARHLGVGWDTIKDIQKRYLQKHFAKPQLGWLERIAIDEISIGKHHKYVTLVLDLDSGAVVFVGEGKGAESLKPFWQRLSRSRAKIVAVATDMSPAYVMAVAQHLPDAVHVLDPFHVIKLFNDKLADLRRQVQRTAQDVEQKKTIKGTLWLLLKNPENLDDTRNERKRLDDALRINQPLAIAYYMKEDLRQFWRQGSKKNAERFLNDWIKRARASGVTMLQKFANTLQQHRAGLLNWYKQPISTGKLEGTNNKIRTFQRQAYGFRDHEFFKLKIYALHTTTYALVG